MRMSQLSTASGVPVATIKYYLREGLLPAGVATSANQTDYSDEHVRRLKLIRALIQIGGLTVATARTVLEAVDTPDLPLTHIFGVAQHSISGADLYDPVEDGSGTAKVAALIERRGWAVEADNPGARGAARVLDAYERIGHPELAEIWDGYADGAELIATADLEAIARLSEVSAMAETVVVGTVLGDALVASLRRMAQAHVSFQMFPAPMHERENQS